MELFIKIVDGQPFQHPILGANLRNAFPEIDTNNLPADFARFIRVPCPSHSRFEKPSVKYEWVDGVVMDVWTLTPMTSEEKETIIMQERAAVLQMKDQRIERCKNMISELSDPIQKAIWQECLDAHEEWVLESLSPISPKFPMFPARNADGTWTSRIGA